MEQECVITISTIVFGKWENGLNKLMLIMAWISINSIPPLLSPSQFPSNPCLREMKLPIQVLSKDIVKPSSATPDHLRHYKLSFLDQVTADVYNAMLYFFSSDGDSNFDVNHLSNQLKTSLSELLTCYYPLAGRVNYGDLFIHCNDAGIPFLQVHVKRKLSDLLNHSMPTDLNNLLPFELDDLTDISMGVQFNVFDCGGVALGVCISHKISDALSFFTVVNSWASVCRGESVALDPVFDSAKLFPPKNMPMYNTRNSIVRERTAKRFNLDASKLESLRSKFSGSAILEDERRPSRVEALSAFLYGRFLKAINEDSPTGADDDNKLYLVCHAVNIRSKLDPPLPLHAFGNLYRNAMTIPSPETMKDEYCKGLVTQVREEVSKIDKEFLKQFQEDNTQLQTIKDRSSRFVRGEMVTCAFTSLCRFPLYEADFGWGKPVWVASPALYFKNLFVFFDSKWGGGIDFVVHLQEEVMAKLEADEELLKYATPIGTAE